MLTTYLYSSDDFAVFLEVVFPFLPLLTSINSPSQTKFIALKTFTEIRIAAFVRKYKTNVSSLCIHLCGYFLFRQT